MSKSKKYIKKKDSDIKGPNATGPKFRTADHFKGKSFSGFDKKGGMAKSHFNPGQFKVQHKG